MKRRQSELPSDLIDWEAPEIPELDKQRIVYEDYIKELTEEHAIDQLLNEEIFTIAHETIVDEYKNKVKNLEEEVTKERSTVNLMLNQVRLFEDNIKENDLRIEDLENETTMQRNTINDLEHEKENWTIEVESLKSEVENLNFRNSEIMCELDQKLEIHIQMTDEIKKHQKKIAGFKAQLDHYKRLAKGNAAREDEN